MKPLNCCKNCSGLKNGKFRNKLRCIFCEEYAKELNLKLYNEQKGEKGCSTCIHCKHVYDYPAYVTGGECVCTVGLECDLALRIVRKG